MNIKQLRYCIACYVSLEPNDDFGMEKYWKEIIYILSEDISDTIHFFESECTDEELYWLGSIFEDVAEKTQSEELIKVLRNRLAKVTPEAYSHNIFETKHMQKRIDYVEYIRSINSDIDYAEDRIKE